MLQTALRVAVGGAAALAAVAVAAVLAWAYRRRRKRAAACRCEASIQSRPGEMPVVLVHGTFARHAPWLDDDSSFVTSLKRAVGRPVEVHPFCWSGANSHVRRMAAGVRLAARIEAIREASGERVFVVAHSHGGNVALQAAGHAPGAMRGLVTLATPFLYFSGRHLPRLRLLGTFALVAFAVVLAGGGLAGEWLRWSVAALAVALVGLAAWSTLIAVRHVRRLARLVPGERGALARAARDEDEVAAWLNPAHPELPDTLVLTPMGDEAAMGLTGAQLTGWLMAPFQRIGLTAGHNAFGVLAAGAMLLGIVLLVAIIAGSGLSAMSEANPESLESALPGFVLAWLVDASEAAAERFDDVESSAPIHPFVFFGLFERLAGPLAGPMTAFVTGAAILAVVGLVAALARALSLLAVGGDALFWATRARPVVQQAPLGRSTIETLDMGGPQGSLLHHGRVYASGEVPGRWIRERVGRS